MQIYKVCNNIKISQIDCSTIYYLYQYLMFNYMSEMSEK